ncbi:hypothetical protein E2N92_12450 [Methanofollis formosanus]|uniref:Uncharacterized protein n=1 Tax=Methanofollis formosanus TaxID=299308 RepID=A0A8G1A2X2_9EURY|nr:hypothetical protein [Methanofollis formosanus]QYZ80182.1 hypothetical protein E2N92_12450 [Methanofollis formosanus]
MDLVTNARYEIWVVECYGGPERISVLVHKGPYVVFDDTFDLMRPEHDYLPYKPEFRVREDGTYMVHVKPLDEGVFRIGIRRYPPGILEGIFSEG